MPSPPATRPMMAPDSSSWEASTDRSAMGYAWENGEGEGGHCSESSCLSPSHD